MELNSKYNDKNRYLGSKKSLTTEYIAQDSVELQRTYTDKYTKDTY